MRNATVEIIRLLMRLAAVYSFILAAACLLLAGKSAVGLFICDLAPNDSASGLDPIGVVLALAGGLIFVMAGRWGWKSARAFGGEWPLKTAADKHQNRPA